MSAILSLFSVNKFKVSDFGIATVLKSEEFQDLTREKKYHQ